MIDETDSDDDVLEPATAGASAPAKPAKKKRVPRATWLKRAGELPETPGVYLMKDADGKVVYVGKAKNLKSRVRSYFQEGTSDYRAFVGMLSGILADLETVVTRSEKEALLLERELIRKHEPRFNVIWRDDKQFLCLRIDTSHEYPWVQVVRQMGKDGARYFGPFHSATSARKTLRVVNRHFRLRTCRDSVLYNRTRPCLEYQIGRCPAPCVFEIDRAKYREGVDDVLMFLEGKGEELVSRLEERMWGAAERMDYEVAAHYRDQIAAVNRTLEKQQIASASLLDQDVFGLHREGRELCVSVLEVRRGRVENVTSHFFEEAHFDEGRMLESFLLQRYADELDGTEALPGEILVPIELEGADALSELLSEKRGAKVVVKVPQRGDRAGLLEMAKDNAAHGFAEKQRTSGVLERTLQGLKDKLRLRNFPTRIECYDISNMQGGQIVGSGVSFVGALPHKAGYRRYKVKTTKGQDDFASMYEVLSRRVKRGLEQGDLPDLLVIDGGKGQLNVARAVLKDFGVETVDLISLAKSRVTGQDDDDAPERSPERVFMPGAKEPVVLRQDSPELLLLARIRDEAHRFAITFHKQLRQKARMKSSLEDIPGIGAIRKRALLRELGSLKRIREASVEELARVGGVGRAAAERVHAFFHGGADPELVGIVDAEAELDEVIEGGAGGTEDAADDGAAGIAAEAEASAERDLTGAAGGDERFSSPAGLESVDATRPLGSK
ncbi:excinuclease ABC subunit UvrC [Myxococcota bacterium]|nr:excinuclease ABC subunit UvrC [Myxococcota bacterium]